MRFLTDRIAYGESYDLEVEARDTDGEAVILDGTWSAAYRFCKSEINGTEVQAGPMNIVGGKARADIDTGDAPFEVGVFWWDVRLTDPDGNDYWSQPVRLILENRNALAS